jgi:hypothetical protein
MTNPRHLYLIDSITQITPAMSGGIVVSGSHGGVSSSRYVEAQPLKPWAVFLNDAGVGKNQAGIAALSRLEPYGVLVFCYSHESACIGQAQDALACGWVRFVNKPVLDCSELGAPVGQSVSDLVRKLGGQMPVR